MAATKTVEINGAKYILRQWTVKDWRRMDELSKDKDLIAQWIIVTQGTVVNDVGELYLADKTEWIEENLSLNTLEQINKAALEYNLPFYTDDRKNSSQTIPS